MLKLKTKRLLDTPHRFIDGMMAGIESRVPICLILLPDLSMYLFHPLEDCLLNTLTVKLKINYRKAEFFGRQLLKYLNKAK